MEGLCLHFFGRVGVGLIRCIQHGYNFLCININFKDHAEVLISV